MLPASRNVWLMPTVPSVDVRQPLGHAFSKDSTPVPGRESAHARRAREGQLSGGRLRSALRRPHGPSCEGRSGAWSTLALGNARHCPNSGFLSTDTYRGSRHLIPEANRLPERLDRRARTEPRVGRIRPSPRAAVGNHEVPVAADRVLGLDDDVVDARARQTRIAHQLGVIPCRSAFDFRVFAVANRELRHKGRIHAERPEPSPEIQFHVVVDGALSGRPDRRSTEITATCQPVSGTLRGAQLTERPAIVCFWPVWVAFRLEKRGDQTWEEKP